MNPQCGDSLFYRFLGTNLMDGTARLLGGVGVIVIVLGLIIKLL